MTQSEVPVVVRTEELLGEGAFGRVYKCKWKGQVAAAKLLKASFSAPEEEIKTMAFLRHRHLIRIIEFVRSPSGFIVMMEYFDGTPLSAWCYSDTNFNTTTVQKLSLLWQCWSGLQYVHSMNYVHCDLHPGNIMISFDCVHAVILDLGLAKFQSSAKQALGSKPPFYSAPECEKNESENYQWPQSADVFSMGICQAEFLGKGQFWVEEADGDLMHPLKVVSFLLLPSASFHMIPLLQGFQPSVRENIIEPALSWNPEDRSSIRDMLTSLHTMIAQFHANASPTEDDSVLLLKKNKGSSQRDLDLDIFQLDRIEHPFVKNSFQAILAGDHAEFKACVNRSSDWEAMCTPTGLCLLHVAVMIKNIDAVKILVDLGADINQKGTLDEVEMTPLHLSLLGEPFSPISLMLLGCPDIDVLAKPPNGKSPFQTAIAIGNVAAAAIILCKEPNEASVPDDDGKTPLLAAIDQNDFGMAALLLETGNVDCNAPDKTKRPPFYAALQADLELVKLLYRHGADYNFRNSLDRTPFWNAVCLCREDIVQFLLELDDIDIGNNDTGITALHEAAANSNVEVVRLLVESRKFDINAADTENAETPLHKAVTYDKCPEVLKYLIKNGADLEAQESDLKETPLHKVCREGYLGVVKLLLSHGANANALTTEAQFSPLMQAILYGHTDIALCLIAHSETNLELGALRHTHLCEAARTGQFEIVKMLVQNGANINAKAGHGAPFITKHHTFYVDLMGSPLYLAAEAGHTRIVEFLINQKKLLINPDHEPDIKQPVDIAAENGHLSIVQLLVEAGVYLGEHTLCLAVKSGSVELVQQLSKHFPKNAINMIYFEHSPIHLAAEKGEGKILEWILSNGGDPNLYLKMAVNFDKIDVPMVHGTPLLAAAISRRKEAAEILISHGGRIACTDKGAYINLNRFQNK